MTMASLGIYLRWLCLVFWLSYQIYFLVHGSNMIRNGEGEMAGIFMCENSDDLRMTQCTGLDDVTSCGDGIQCVQSSCGRPLFPHIGVSYAGSSDPFDPDAATSTKSFLTITSLVYSLVPYIFHAYFTVHFLAFGNVVALTRLGMMLLTFLVNNAFLKNLVKQPRPTGSCLYFHAYGMPSGHAAGSIGFLTFMLLELFHNHPNLLGNRCVTMSSNREVEEKESGKTLDENYTYAWGYGWQKQITIPESNGLEVNQLSRVGAGGGADNERSLLPTSSSISSDELCLETMSHNIIQTLPKGFHLQSKWLHHYGAILWIIILLPVPLSRVHLHDHSPMQVLMGSVVGAGLGLIWYFCFIRGWLFGSMNVNSQRIMAYLVKCRVGKWIGLNLGAGEGRIHVNCS